MFGEYKTREEPEHETREEPKSVQDEARLPFVGGLLDGRCLPIGEAFSGETLPGLPQYRTVQVRVDGVDTTIAVHTSWLSVPMQWSAISDRATEVLRKDAMRRQADERLAAFRRR